MSLITTFKVAALVVVYASSASAASSSADPSTFNNETFYNSTSIISSEPTPTPIALPSPISDCASCSYPPRSSRTAPGPIPAASSELSTTTTIFTTVTYTITSCGAAVTNCPVGRITTESIPLYVTVCPVGTPLPSLPVGPPGTEHPVYSSFIILSGASPVPKIEPPQAIATNAGIVVTPKLSAAVNVEPSHALEPPVEVATNANAGVVVTPEPSHAASNQTSKASEPPTSVLAVQTQAPVPEATTKASEGVVTLEAAGGVAASTGLPPTSAGCAGAQCTQWISEASVGSINVLGTLVVVTGGFLLFL